MWMPKYRLFASFQQEKPPEKKRGSIMKGAKENEETV
jgi:hypothetical protein